jgi:hypothetical protein
VRIDLLLINQKFNADSLVNAWSKMQVHDSVPAVHGSFLHTGNKLFEANHSVLSGNPLINPDQFWIFYLLFGFLALFAFIKYYYSHDLRTMFSALAKSPFKQEVDSGGKVSFVVTVFLFANFLGCIGLLVVAINQKYHFFPGLETSVFNVFLVSALAALIYYLFNEISILFLGFVFGVTRQAMWYAKTSSGIVYTLGIVLLPFFLFYFFTSLNIILYISVGVVVVFVLYKWLLLLRNSYSINHFTIFHNILYLCALEIIPIMLLIKVSMGSI